MSAERGLRIAELSLKVYILDRVIESKIAKVLALCRYGISENGCMWERCRPPEINIFTIIKGDKEGQTTG